MGDALSTIKTRMNHAIVVVKLTQFWLQTRLITIKRKFQTRVRTHIIYKWEILDFGESDEMIKISGKVDKSNTYNGFSKIWKSSSVNEERNITTKPVVSVWFINIFYHIYIYIYIYICVCVCLSYIYVCVCVCVCLCVCISQIFLLVYFMESKKKNKDLGV